MLNVLIILVVLATCALPWVLFFQVQRLRQELADIKLRLGQASIIPATSQPIIPALASASQPMSPHQREMQSAIENLPQQPVVPSQPFQPVSNSTLYDEFEIEVQPVVPRTGAQASGVLSSSPDAKPAESTQPKASSGFEQQFGAKLPVWFGGISLALAGFYFVKYSIENQLISPELRIFLGLLFGGGLIAAGRWMFRRPDLANSQRLCQALTGAGIVTLYGSLFAAHALYDLIPSMLCFFAMLAVTIGAVILSISQGPVVAMFGLAGGFLTPILVGSDEPNTLLLFLYLYGLSGGLLYLARRQGWNWLSLPVYVCALAWSMIWVVGMWNAEDSVWAALYVLLLVLTDPLLMKGDENDEPDETISFPVMFVGSLASLLMLSFIVARAEFTGLHWSLFGLASLATIALAVFKPHHYRWLPVGAGVVASVLLFLWQAPTATDFFTVLGCFSVVYFVAGFVFMTRTLRHEPWSVLCVGALPVAYAISYVRHEALVKDWPLAAFALAAILIAVVARMATSLRAGQHKEMLQGIGSLLAVLSLSWGFYLLLAPEYLMIAYAAQICGVAWLSRRFSLQVMPAALIVVSALLAVSLFEYATNLIALIAGRETLDSQALPIYALGATALLLLASGGLVQIRAWKTGLFTAGAALVLCVVIIAVQSVLPDDKYIARIITLNLLWAATLAALVYGREKMRRLVMMFTGYAVFQTVVIDLVASFSRYGIRIGETPLWNALIPAFALPSAWMWAAGKWSGTERARSILSALSLIYMFFFITTEVMQFYHGGLLFVQAKTLPEIYTLSVVWLVFGLVLLVWGTMKNDRIVRIGSLVVMILTVAKVFLYDASNLEGILRVLSFLGLGASLIGLGYFYPRYVFRRGQKS